MSSNLDRIARVDISLDTPISNDANFDNILIIGPAPATPATGVEVPLIGAYSTLSEVTDMGYVATGTGADPVGVAARVAFSQTPRPNTIYIAAIPAAQTGEDAPTPPTLTEILTAALEVNGWYCICPVALSDNDTKAVIQWTETQDKLCGYVEFNPSAPLYQAGLYLRSYGVFGKVTSDQLTNDIPLENRYGMAVAMAIKALHYHAGEETWALKSLEAVTPAKVNSTFVTTLNNANISYVTSTASKNITMGGKTNGGEWIDIIRFRDWLKNDMQVRIVNLLVANPKIPYTDGGIGLVENQMLASLKEGQKYGGIAPTEYNAENRAKPGYVTSVPIASELSATQKASRVLTDCKFSARLAGAIHLVEVSGSLTYENL